MFLAGYTPGIIMTVALMFVVHIISKKRGDSPTEAGGVAVLFCFVVGVFVYKKLKWEHVSIILKDTVYGIGFVMLLIIGAKVFGYYLTLERIPQMITTLLVGFTDNRYMLLFIVNLLLLFVGMFTALVILPLLLVPAALKVGIDPIQFGVILIVNIMIGGITPSFGSIMFITCTIVGVKLDEFVKEVLPFILALLVVLAILTYSETIALYIPNLLM